MKQKTEINASGPAVEKEDIEKLYVKLVTVSQMAMYSSFLVVWASGVEENFLCGCNEVSTRKKDTDYRRMLEGVY